MSSVWRPLENPPVLPKLHLSEEGQILFNYISRLYHRPITTNFQSQIHPIKDDETWFFAKPSDQCGDSYAHQNVLNRKEIKIKAELIVKSETSSCSRDNFNKFDSIHRGEASAESCSWTAPVKRRQSFKETEGLPSPKKYYSQMMSQDKENYEHRFSAGHSQIIPHTSQETSPFFTQTTSNSQIYRKISGRGSPPLFN